MEKVTKVCVCMAQGFEEVEMLTVVDLLRRANMEVTIVSVTHELYVKGAHNIEIGADRLFEEVNFDEYDLIFLPGGMPGTLNLGKHAGVVEQIKKFAESGRRVAAVCAAPSVLGENGLLQGKKAVCYPGFEEKLEGANVLEVPVVTDGNITTSRGMGCCIELGLELIRLYQGEETAQKLKEAIIAC